MSDDHTGEMTEWDILVQRIRAMDDPERDSENARREAAQYDLGWREACSWLDFDLRENKRAFGRRIERRVRNEYRAAQRRDRFENLCAFTVVFVMAIALYWITRP